MAIFTVCYLYQYVFMFLSFILEPRDRKKREARRDLPPTGNRYAVLICGRNEENVIGDLIDCLKAQDYEGEITTFVMADNCDDSTADIARRHGAVVYERHNTELIGKGYAMDVLMKNIARDYPDSFDGFFVFDADNLLPADFISQMDKMIAEGWEVLTGYRNAKNYGDSWISASNGLWYMRENRFMNHTRSMLGLSSTITGTGFYFSKRIADELGGWPYHSLTEDTEFSADIITRGNRIGYCPEAVIYDEQTTTLRQSWRQRLRWSRGYLQVLKLKGWKLLKGLFKPNFSCYDMIMSIAPAFALSTITTAVNIITYIVIIATGGDIAKVLVALAQMLFGMYNTMFLIGLLACISEWKKIRASSFKKILSIIVLPIFMLTYIPIAMEALFVKPVWKPITHTVTKEQLNARADEEKLPAAE